MWQVVDAKTFETGRLRDRGPGLLQVHAGRSIPLAGDYVRIVFKPGQSGQYRLCSRGQVDRLGAGLAVGKMNDAALEIDVLPLGMENLPEASPRQDQEPNRRNRVCIQHSAPPLRLGSVLCFR